MFFSCIKACFPSHPTLQIYYIKTLVFASFVYISTPLESFKNVVHPIFSENEIRMLMSKLNIYIPFIHQVLLENS